MSSKNREKDDIAAQTAAILSVLDANSNGGGNAHLPRYAVNALQSLSGNQLSFLDPNVMMMSNAAATIAAVAASAVHHLNQGGSGSGSSSVASGSTGTTIPPALLASLRSVASSQSGTSSSQSQLAALLAAAGAAGRNGMQLQGSGAAQSLPANLQHILSQVEASKSKPPPPLPPVAPPHTTSVVPSTPHTGMQTWSLEQLEKHVSLLRQMNQPVPQSVGLLLADAQRKEKKKTAKRAANRKSASTSRARKKTLVEEMTRANARLKRQALILSLLPDLVVATSLEGEINFCSAQVERILGHKTEDVVGLQLDQLLVPSSRDALQKLFKRLLNPNKSRNSRQSQSRRGTKRRQGEESGEKGDGKCNGQDGKACGGDAAQGSSQSGDGNSGNTGINSSGAAIISEQSFPLSVVEVDSKPEGRRKEADSPKGRDRNNNSSENSDNSTSNISESNNSGSKQQVSSLSNGTGLSRSPAEYPSEDDGAQGRSKASTHPKTSKKGKSNNSSDDSSSSLSADAKNMSNANDNLDRNVRWHNQRMMEESQKPGSESGPKDDVTGASVTVNNASARLSSLKHVPSPQKKIEQPTIRYENDQSSSDDSLLAGVEEKKKVGNTSDDSGYRESNDSREETSSSGSDSSNAKKRRKPLAPTCRLLLIRADLSTVWCEVTSSLRSRSVEDETMDMQLANLKSSDSTILVEEPTEAIQEFLLCFRPMRDGEKKADESLRLVSSRVTSDKSSPFAFLISSSGNDSNSVKQDSEKTSGDGSASKSDSTSSKKGPSKRPPKKRQMDGSESKEGRKSHKKSKGEENSAQGSEAEKSVVESLMLMNKSQQRT